MAQSINQITEKLEEIKIDLSYERKFLDETTEKLGTDLKTVKFQLIWVKIDVNLLGDLCFK